MTSLIFLSLTKYIHNNITMDLIICGWSNKQGYTESTGTTSFNSNCSIWAKQCKHLWSGLRKIVILLIYTINTTSLTPSQLPTKTIHTSYHLDLYNNHIKTRWAREQISRLSILKKSATDFHKTFHTLKRLPPWWAHRIHSGSHICHLPQQIFGGW